MGSPGPNCKKRICKLCGTEFLPKSTHQSCCGREIQVPCAVCGTLFTKLCTTSDNTKTCSEKCRLEYQKIRRSENAKQIVKKCKWCGKEFTASHVRVVYCDGPHYKKCAVCGKYFEFDPKTQLETQTCSKDCFVQLQLSHRDLEAEAEKMKQVLFEKYGVYNAAQIPGSQEKAQNTSREKYGSDWYMQTDEYKDRIKKTSLEKYGYEHWLSSPEIITKREATVEKKYGAKNVFASEEVKEQIHNHWRENFDVDYPSQVHIEDLDTWLKFKDNPESYMKEHFPDGTTFQQLSHDLGVSDMSVKNIIYADTDLLENYILRDFSKMETSVSIFLNDIVPGIKIHHNLRKLLCSEDRVELDLFLPDYNVGIECNPAWTHNSSILDPWEQNKKDMNYHLRKTELAEQAGIRLVHLFGYEWQHRREACEGLLIDILGVASKLYDYDDIVVRQRLNEECREFLEKYDLHGAGQFNDNLCLVDEDSDEIIVVMTFNETSAKEFEITRLCFKPDTYIRHAVKKMFDEFIYIYEPLSVITKVDRAHYTSKMFEQLGFKIEGHTDPSFKWVNTVTEKFREPEEFSGVDEEDILSMNFVKVYDSGKVILKWDE